MGNLVEGELEFVGQSLLFVPASREDRFEKAVSSGCDLVCLDLEDAVPQSAKAIARENANAFFSNSVRHNCSLRISAVTSDNYASDIEKLGEFKNMPDFILLPKVENVGEISEFDFSIGSKGLRVIPLIETPKGLRNSLEIARHPKTAAIMFGGADFCAEMGCEFTWDNLLHARNTLLIASSEAKKPLIDVPHIGLEDTSGLEEETRKIKSMGFSAKAAIHPNQIDTIHKVMRPSEAEYIEAIEALAFFEKNDRQAARFNGKLLEEPIIRRFNRLVILWEKFNA